MSVASPEALERIWLLVDQAREAEDRNDIVAAADLFGEAAALDENPDLHLWHGVRLIRLGRYLDAANVLEHAIALAPTRADIAWHFARSLCHKPRKAREILQRLVEGGSLDIHIHVEYIELVDSLDKFSCVSDVLAQSEHVLAENQAFAVFAGSKWLAMGMCDLSAVSFARAFQLSPEQPASVYQAAARAVLMSHAEPPAILVESLHASIGRNDFCRETLDVLHAISCRSAALKAWAYFIDPAFKARPSVQDVALLENASLQALRHVFEAQSSIIREVRTDEFERFADLVGCTLVDPLALHRSGFDFDVWFEKHELGDTFCRTESALFQRKALSTSAADVQENMLRDGYLSLVSPLDGMLHKSHSGFVLEYLRDRGIPHAGSGAAYFVSSGEPAFVMFSGEDNWPMAWFFPKLNVIVRERGFIEIDRYFLPNIVDLQSVIASNFLSSIEYCSRDGCRRDPVAVFGSSDFISTHLFEDISGFDRAVARGLDHCLKRVILSSYEPYGKFEELFPELASSSTVYRPSISDCASYNKIVQDLDALPVRVAGGFATDGAAARVLAVAEQKVHRSWTRGLARLRAKNFPILVLNLRVERRRWMVSPPEIACVLDRFVSTYPNAALVFDGTVLLSGSSKTESVIAAEEQLIADIVSSMQFAAPTIKLVGRTIHQAMIATEKSDMHLSIQGTSTTRAVLISNKPGVILGPRSFWWDVRNYREKPAKQIDLRSYSTDLHAKNISDADFMCSPEVVLEALLTIAESLPRRLLKPHEWPGALIDSSAVDSCLS